ncbi:MAG: flagellar basal body P-ring formation chaperone FlgA [Gemmatimonadota bacterium]
MRLSIQLLVLATAVLAPRPVVAQEPPVPAIVDARAREAVATRWAVSSEDLVLEWGGASGSIAENSGVEIAGTGRNGYWIVRLQGPTGNPVSVQLRTGWLASRPVAARSLQRGQVVTEDDVSYRKDVVWNAPSLGVPFVKPLGWVSQRSVRRGEVLQKPTVRPPLLVSSGRPVEIRWRRNGVGITAAGTAVGTGALGESVYVRTASGKRMRGVVVAPGTVDVSGDGHR